MWQDLIDIINKLIYIYSGLYNLNKRKRKAVIDGDMSSLNDIVDEEKKLTHYIIQAEQKRQQILRQLARTNISIDEHATAKMLQGFCPLDKKKSFSVANATLSAKVKEVSSIADANRLLLRGAMTAVNMNINSLAGMKQNPSYGQNGTQGFAPQQKGLDYKA